MADSFAVPLEVAQMVDLGVVVSRSLERMHAELGMLLRQNLDEQQRKAQLAAYLHSSRQQLLRMHQLLQWANKAKALAECLDSGKVLDIALSHSRTLKVTADELYAAYMHLLGLSAPNIDLQSALEVLTTGTYSRVPLGIELPIKPPLPPALRASCRQFMDDKILSHLLKARIPSKIQVDPVVNGSVTLRMAAAYEVQLTLTPAPQAAPVASEASSTEEGVVEDVVLEWDLIKLVMLPGMEVASLQDVQAVQLQGDLRQRMHLAARAARAKAREPPSTDEEDATGLEADEFAYPIHLMHSILQDIAANIITNGANVVLRRLVSASDWGGHITIEPPTVLVPGLRVTYWRKTGVLCELEMKSESGHPPTTAAVVPALEVGIAEDGWLQVTHIPAFPPLPASAQLSHIQPPTKFKNIELLLLQSAAYHAHHQLVYLEKAVQLLLEANPISPVCHFSWSSSRPAQAHDGEESANPPLGALDVACPVLEFCADGAVLLLLTIHLWTGMITLRPGRLFANATGRGTVQLLLKEESRLQALQLDLLKRTGDKHPLVAAGATAPSLVSLQQCPLVAAIGQLCHVAFRQMWLSGFMHCARVLSLQPNHHPLNILLDAYTRTNSTRTNEVKTDYVQLAFPPELCCMEFPRLDLTASTGNNAADAFSTQPTVPRGLQFYLRLPSTLQNYTNCSLVVVACNTQHLPLQVLDVLPVPLSVVTHNSRSLMLGKRARVEHDCDVVWRVPKSGYNYGEGKLAKRRTSKSVGAGEFLAGTAWEATQLGSLAAADWRLRCEDLNSQLQDAADDDSLLREIDTHIADSPVMEALVRQLVSKHAHSSQPNGQLAALSSRLKVIRRGLVIASVGVRELSDIDFYKGVRDAVKVEQNGEDAINGIGDKFREELVKSAAHLSPSSHLFFSKLSNSESRVGVGHLLAAGLQAELQRVSKNGANGEEKMLHGNGNKQAQHGNSNTGDVRRESQVGEQPEASTSGGESERWGYIGSDQMFLHLKNVVEWYQWRRTWETLLIQLQALQIRHVVKLGRLKSPGPSSLVKASSISITSIPGVLSLPYPVISTQHHWQSSSDAMDPESVLQRVELRVEEPAVKGAWSCSIYADWAERAASRESGSSGSSTGWPAARGREAVAIPGGCKFMYELSSGHTIVSALQDLVRTIRIQVLLSRLRQMVPDTPAPHADHPHSQHPPHKPHASSGLNSNSGLKQEPGQPAAIKSELPTGDLLDPDLLDLVGAKSLSDPDVKSNGVMGHAADDRAWSPDLLYHEDAGEGLRRQGKADGADGKGSQEAAVRFVDPLTGCSISLEGVNCTCMVLQVHFPKPSPPPSTNDMPAPEPSFKQEPWYDDGWQILDTNTSLLLDTNGPPDAPPTSTKPPAPSLQYFIEWLAPSHLRPAAPAAENATTSSAAQPPPSTAKAGSTPGPVTGEERKPPLTPPLSTSTQPSRSPMESTMSIPMSMPTTSGRPPEDSRSDPSSQVLQSLLGQVHSCVTSQPDLPPPVLAALEQMLQYNCEDSFLDTLLLTSQPLLALAQLGNSEADAEQLGSQDEHQDGMFASRQCSSVGAASGALSHGWTSYGDVVEVVLREEGAPCHFHVLLSGPCGVKSSAVEPGTGAKGKAGDTETLLIDVQPLLGGLSCLRFARADAANVAAGAGGSGSGGPSVTAATHAAESLQAFEEQLKVAMASEVESGACTVVSTRTSGLSSSASSSGGSSSIKPAPQAWLVRNHSLSNMLRCVRQIWKGESVETGL